jgi:hypothetical protein
MRVWRTDGSQRLTRRAINWVSNLYGIDRAVVADTMSRTFFYWMWDGGKLDATRETLLKLWHQLINEDPDGRI